MIALRDGTRVVIRPIRPEDKEALLRGFEQLSEHSRYRRFFTDKGRLSPAELRYLTEVDQVDHVALAAATEDESRGLGVARFSGSPTAPFHCAASYSRVPEARKT